MQNAIVIHKTGGPEVLSFEQTAIPSPGPGEALIRHTAIGLNFIDTYFRTGLYPAPNGLPFSPGNEGAGVVEALGDGVTSLKVGDRVAYAATIGAYAQYRVIAADRLVKVPDGISDEQAAGMMLKGMTAWYLLRRTHAVKAGDEVLFHAAAGGVGLIAGEWGRHLGARMIGTAGSPDKIALAKAHGYEHVINYRNEDFVAEVARLTEGRKCAVVYDSVGKDTYPGSLDCLRTYGLFVSFGQSSGPIENFNLGLLSQKGSLYATRPTLFTYVAKREDLETATSELFDLVLRGVVTINVNQHYDLRDAAQAHSDLEGRKTTGTTVLIP